MTMTSGLSAVALLMRMNLETRGDLRGNVDRLHRPIGILAHAGDRHHASGDLFIAFGQQAAVADRSPADLDDPQPDIELILETQRPTEVEVGVDARPPDVRVAGMDAQSRLAPQRVLGFLHVAEEPAEMDDAGGVGLVELDPSPQDVFAQRHRVTTATKTRRHEEASGV